MTTKGLFSFSLAVVTLAAVMSGSRDSLIEDGVTSALRSSSRHLLELMSIDNRVSAAESIRDLKRGLTRRISVPLGGDLTAGEEMPCNRFRGCCAADVCTSADSRTCAFPTCAEMDYGSSILTLALVAIVLAILCFLCGIVFWIFRGCCCGGCSAQVNKGCPLCCCKDGDAEFEGYTPKQVLVPKIILFVMGLFAVVTMGLGVAAADEFADGFIALLDAPNDSADSLIAHADSLDRRLSDGSEAAVAAQAYLPSGFDEFEAVVNDGRASVEETRTNIDGNMSTMERVIDQTRWQKAVHGVVCSFVIIAAVGAAISSRVSFGRYLMAPACSCATLFLFVIWILFGIHLFLAVVVTDLCDALDDQLVFENHDTYVYDGTAFTITPVTTPQQRDENLEMIFQMCDEFAGIQSDITTAMNSAATESESAYNEICASNYQIPTPSGQVTVAPTCLRAYDSENLVSNLSSDALELPDITAQAECYANGGSENVCSSITTSVEQCKDSTASTGPCSGDDDSLRASAKLLWDGALGGDLLVAVWTEDAQPILNCDIVIDLMHTARTELCVNSLTANEFLLGVNGSNACIYIIVGICTLLGMKRFQKENMQEIKREEVYKRAKAKSGKQKKESSSESHSSSDSEQLYPVGKGATKAQKKFDDSESSASDTDSDDSRR